MADKLASDTRLIRVDRAHHKALRLVAINRDLSIKEAAEQAIEDYCRKHSAKMVPFSTPDGRPA
jgi:hypothetical protein